MVAEIREQLLAALVEELTPVTPAMLEAGSRAAAHIAALSEKAPRRVAETDFLDLTLQRHPAVVGSEDQLLTAIWHAMLHAKLAGIA